jgi:uncharacterized membrane protein YgdD (TMEM256/DUF423 family)
VNWTAIGAISAFIAVALGAFGAHGLRNTLEPRMLEVFEVGVRYQMYHALALVAVGTVSNANLAGWFFLAGTVLFSGSLYGLALTGARFFGPITPLGGLCFLVGWAMVAKAALTTT